MRKIVNKKAQLGEGIQDTFITIFIAVALAFFLIVSVSLNLTTINNKLKENGNWIEIQEKADFLIRNYLPEYIEPILLGDTTGFSNKLKEVIHQEEDTNTISPLLSVSELKDGEICDIQYVPGRPKISCLIIPTLEKPIILKVNPEGNFR